MLTNIGLVALTLLIAWVIFPFSQYLMALFTAAFIVWMVYSMVVMDREDRKD